MDISVDEEDFLVHFGVKGMHWGIRKDRGSSGAASPKVDRDAAKDAKEFARAQMFYGEGAGTRRKLINKSVEYKRNTVPGYKQAFDKHFASQDMSRHATKAVNERSRTDKKTSVKRGAKYVARRITGEMGSAAAFTALAIAGGAFLASPKGRSLIDDSVDIVYDLMDKPRNRNTSRYLRDFEQRLNNRPNYSDPKHQGYNR